MLNAGLSLETLLQIRESFALHSIYIKTFVFLGRVLGNIDYMCGLYIGGTDFVCVAHTEYYN
jgi:hypothetical protein